MPYLDVFKIKQLKVEHIRNSSHCLTNLKTTLSKFSTSHVLVRSQWSSAKKVWIAQNDGKEEVCFWVTR